MIDETPVRLWRDEAVLVVRRGSPVPLPPRCLKCGAAALATASLRVPGGPVLRLPLCARDSRRRRYAFALGWGGGLLGFVAAVAGVAMDNVAVALLGEMGAMAAVVYGVTASHLLRVSRVDDYFLRLRGADLRYLDGLRSWSDYAEPAA